MKSELYNIYSIILSVIALLVTIAGLYGVFIQIQKIREVGWSNINSKLCDQSFELLKLINDNPNTYDYFYHNKVLLQDAPERVSVLCITEALANFLEHLLLQHNQLPPVQCAVWRRFINSTFNSSVAVCEFITEHSDWYSPDIVAIAIECAQAKQDSVGTSAKGTS